ncbi:hypothetical protein AgCh_007100 [Apium graveolens]
MLKWRAGYIIANGNVYMSDAVFAALDALKFDDIKVVVSGTGWPSAGGDTEFGSGADNAAAYNGNLVRRVLTGGGTPLRPNDALNGTMSNPRNRSKAKVPVASPRPVNKGPSTNGQTWCIANVEAGQEKLQTALDYACGEGGADCKPILIMLVVKVELIVSQSSQVNHVFTRILWRPMQGRS